MPSELGGWGRAVKRGLARGARRPPLLHELGPHDAGGPHAHARSTRARYPGVVVKANRKIRDALVAAPGLAALQPRVPRALRPVVWDINGTPKVFPRAFERLLAPHPRRRPDRRRVQRRLPARGLPDARGADLLVAPPRRQVDDRPALGGPDVPGARIGCCARGSAPMSAARARCDAALARARRRVARPARRSPASGTTADAVDPRLLRAPRARRVLGRARGRRRHAARHARVRAPADRAARRRAAGPVVSYLPLPHPSGLAVDRRAASCTSPARATRTRSSTSARRSPAPPRRRRGADRLPTARSCRCARASSPARSTCTTWRWSAARCTPTPSARTPSSASTPTAATSASGGRAASSAGAAPRFDRNYLQLNSIAAGPTLRRLVLLGLGRTRRRRAGPAHRNFPVDGRGVIFSGATREPIARGLTRPHSARLHRGRALGRQQRLRRGRHRRRRRASSRSPGCPAGRAGSAFAGDVAFVGTSRVLPRFRQYAPGPRPRALRLRRPRASTSRSGTVLGQPALAVRQPDLRRSSRVPAACDDRASRSPSPGAGAPDGERATVLRASSRAPEEDARMSHGLPAADARRHVRERRQHHPPLSRRPPGAVRLSLRVAARHAPGAGPPDLDVPGEVPLAGLRRSTPRRPRTTRRSSTRKARSARARRM